MEVADKLKSWEKEDSPSTGNMYGSVNWTHLFIGNEGLWRESSRLYFSLLPSLFFTISKEPKTTNSCLNKCWFSHATLLRTYDEPLSRIACCAQEHSTLVGEVPIHFYYNPSSNHFTVAYKAFPASPPFLCS